MTNEYNFTKWLIKNYKPTETQIEWAKQIDNVRLMEGYGGLGAGKSWLFDKFERYLTNRLYERPTHDK